MVNKSGDIGTKTATAVCKAFAKHGFPHAERRDETQPDQGDIAGMLDIAVQVKGGHAAEDASLNQIRKWLCDADNQRIAARANIGILITKARGIGAPNAEYWWCYMFGSTYDTITGTGFNYATSQIVLRMTLREAAYFLRAHGWGDALSGDEMIGWPT
jgi:hypothetical protein